MPLTLGAASDRFTALFSCNTQRVRHNGADPRADDRCGGLAGEKAASFGAQNEPLAAGQYIREFFRFNMLGRNVGCRDNTAWSKVTVQRHLVDGSAVYKEMRRRIGMSAHVAFGRDETGAVFIPIFGAAQALKLNRLRPRIDGGFLQHAGNIVYFHSKPSRYAMFIFIITDSV